MSIVYANVTRWDVRVAAPWGVWVPIPPGSHWDSEDPIVKAFPQYFSDDPAVGIASSLPPPEHRPAVFVGPPVEQATAAPGEVRETPRRTRRTQA